MVLSTTVRNRIPADVFAARDEQRGRELGVEWYDEFDTAARLIGGLQHEDKRDFYIFARIGDQYLGGLYEFDRVRLGFLLPHHPTIFFYDDLVTVDDFLARINQKPDDEPEVTFPYVPILWGIGILFFAGIAWAVFSLTPEH